MNPRASIVSSLAALALLLAPRHSPAQATSWNIRSIVNSPSPALAGQICEFTVELGSAAPAAGTVQIAVTCEQDLALYALQETVITGAHTRRAVFRYPLPAQAEGKWKFFFQPIENGITGDQSLHLVLVGRGTDVPGAGAPTPGATMTGPAAASTATPEPGPAATPAPIPGMDLVLSLLDKADAVRGAPGEKRALRYRIECVGTQAASQATIRYGTDLQTSATLVPGPIKPGMRISGTLKFELERSMNEVFVEVEAPAGEDIDTTNNHAALPILFSDPSPYDVSVASSRLVKSDPSPDGSATVEIEVVVRNDGATDIGEAFAVALEGLEGEALRATVNPPLAAGSTRPVRFSGRLPRSEGPRRPLIAIADRDDALREKDEQNNFAALDPKAFTFKGPPVPVKTPTPSGIPSGVESGDSGGDALPDLEFMAARADNVGGGSYRIEATIRNRGKKASPAGVLRFVYLDSSRAMEERDQEVDVDVPALQPGAKIVIPRRLPYGASDQPSFTATVNPLPGAFEEESRANNSVAIQAGAPLVAPAAETKADSGPAAPPDLPDTDIAVLEFSAQPETPRAGSQVFFLVTTDGDFVVDEKGVSHNLEEYLRVYPKGKDGEPINAIYDSTSQQEGGKRTYRFTASYSYAAEDAGKTFEAAAEYRPSGALRDANPDNNRCTATIRMIP